MRILITGIRGFVGPYLENELQKTHEVFGIDFGTSEKNVFQCDLQQFVQVKDVIHELKPDVVAHLAALSSVAQSWDDPQSIIAINQKITRNLYQALESENLKAKVLLISSAEVYAKDQNYPLTENSEIGPSNPYAQSKVAQEKVAAEFSDIPTVISRSFNHTGPGQKEIFVLSSFAKQIAEVEKGVKNFVSVGNLAARRDFSDVRDVVRAYRLLIEKGKPDETYNICSGTSNSISELLSMLIGLSNHKIQTQKDPERLRPSDTPEFWGTYSKIQKETGWAPEIPLRQTLLDLLDFWRNQIST